MTAQMTAPLSPKEKLRNELAFILKEDPANITATHPRWSKLMQEGVLVSLHIGRWRAKTSLNWEDLGLTLDADADASLQQVIDLGHKKLLPADLIRKLDNVEGRARRLLERKAYRTHWGLFVPVKTYPEWKAENAKLRSEYFHLRDTIVHYYEDIIMNLLADYRVAAREAYHRLVALSPASIDDWPHETAFVENFTKTILRHIPNAASVQASFYFDIELNYVPLPTLMAEEDAMAQRIQNEQVLANKQVWAEEEKLEAEVRAARDAAWHKEQMMREMHQDVVQQARKKKEEQVDTFLRDVVLQLRSMVYDVTTNTLEAIQRNNKIPPATLGSLKNMLKQVGKLNFHQDEEIEQMLSKVKVELDSATTSTAAIERNLKDIATVVKASLIGLGDQPRQARVAGLAETPSEMGVRTARRRLGLAVEGEEPLQVEIPQMKRRQSRRSLAQAEVEVAA